MWDGRPVAPIVPSVNRLIAGYLRVPEWLASFRRYRADDRPANAVLASGRLIPREDKK
jgi:hypothetical protein